MRNSILRYKFHSRRSYGAAYGRLLAQQLTEKPLCRYDVLTYIPISALRRWKRGFDQTELIAKSAGLSLGTPAVPVLKKTRHTRAQSQISNRAQRKANILGAYSVPDATAIAGKTVLLIDDLITTGATCSEAARVLLSAGARAVYCAAVATPPKIKKHR